MLSERIKGFAGDEERGWIGKDVSLQKNILINPHGIRVARLATQPGSFPFELKEGAEERLSASMRSRYAQIGLHPADDSLEYALESYFNAQDTDSFEFPFAITNFSNAPISWGHQAGFVGFLGGRMVRVPFTFWVRVGLL